MARTTASRPVLTRDVVVRTAIAVGDADGVEAVSIRRVASELGVTPMALYRYVESKDELLIAVADLAYGEVELPDPAAVGWWEGIASVAYSFRRVFLSHPAAAAIVTSRSAEGPNAMRILECILALLRKAGFGIEEAVQIQTALVRFIISLVAFEVSLLPELSEDEREQKARRLRFELESLPQAAHPNLIAAAPYLTAPHDPERTFEQALDLLKAGIESRLR
jgi:AcrR family transcriptional regulator